MLEDRIEAGVALRVASRFEEPIEVISEFNRVWGPSPEPPKNSDAHFNGFDS